MRAALAALLTASMLTAEGAIACAQDASLEATLERGVALREASRDAEALALFRGAWERTHSPRALAQIAMAEHALGHWVDAESHLREALDTTDPWVQRNRAALRGLMATLARRVASLEVRGTPAGAEVRVDGVRVGSLPLTARVARGAVRLEVSATDYAPTVRQVEVGSGPVTVAEVALAPGRSGRGALRTLAWVAAGTGAAALVGTAVSFALHESTVSRYDDGCLGRSAPIGAESPSCQDDRNAEGTLRTLSTAGLIAGLGLGALSGVLFLAAPSRRETRSAGIVCGVGPGSIGVACGGRF